MNTINKQFHFCAAHHLTGLPEDHPCGRQHGHNYIVIAELSSTKLDDHSFVQDYNDLKPIKSFIDDVLDHRDLNTLAGSFPLLAQPTAENIAKTLFDAFKPKFPLLHAISVKETDKTIARYEPGFD